MGGVKRVFAVLSFLVGLFWFDQMMGALGVRRPLPWLVLLYIASWAFFFCAGIRLWITAAAPKQSTESSPWQVSPSTRLLFQIGLGLLMLGALAASLLLTYAAVNYRPPYDGALHMLTFVLPVVLVGFVIMVAVVRSWFPAAKQG